MSMGYWVMGAGTLLIAGLAVAIAGGVVPGMLLCASGLVPLGFALFGRDPEQ
jgi:hypothetical protein